MTIQALYQKMTECLEKLNHAAVIDDAVFDLEILVTQLRIRLHAGIYDPMKTFDSGQSCEVSKILELTEEMEQHIPLADARAKVVAELASLAKGVLRREGIPFYS